MDRARISPVDAIILLKAAAIYAMVTVPYFKSMGALDRNKEAEKVLARHLDDLRGFLRMERKRLGILESWMP